MKIIDTHQHLWDLDLFSYSWCRTIPELNRSFLMQDYVEASEGVEVVKTVFVEPDVDEDSFLDETRSILTLADEDNLLEGVVAGGRPENPGFKDYIHKIAGHPKLKGIRRILHVHPDELSESTLFVENIRSLADYGLSFDICVLERQLPKAIKLIEKCPRVSFVLDHCGNPRVKEREVEPWLTNLKEVASFPNVVCKISGIVVNADRQNWTADDLSPYVDRVIDTFGWDRVMFGSDWPVCTLASSYRRWVETLISLTSSAGEANQRKLFYENAERVYRLTQ
ncbi:MAG TPA: amidohydrolase [Blastocatellia bacterium]|nr:amidohydrolase [Blastocatellia bacterium]